MIESRHRTELHHVPGPVLRGRCPGGAAQAAEQLRVAGDDLAAVRAAAAEGLRQRRGRRSTSSGSGRSPRRSIACCDADGSFVFDLGGAWNRGSGTRSLYPYELILRLCKLFHLAQEFYWYNPSKLPTPAEWVTIRRTRVKDAVNTLWWLSKTRHAARPTIAGCCGPTAGRCTGCCTTATRRPSGRRSTTSARTSAATTAAPFRPTCCKCRTRAPATTISVAAGPPACRSIRPAFPPPVPEFFIRFLTEPGQLVLDPFAGSNMTGHVAERLERRWLSIEINADYVAGSRLRFDDALTTSHNPVPQQREVPAETLQQMVVDVAQLRRGLRR